MFGQQKRTQRALDKVTEALNRLSDASQEVTQDPLESALGHRVDSLERQVKELVVSVSKDAAESQALLIKATSVFKAARSAEERGRILARADEVDEEGEDELSLEQLRAIVGDGLLPDDAPGGEDEGLPSVPVGVERGAPDDEERLLTAAKWGT